MRDGAVGGASVGGEPVGDDGDDDDGDGDDGDDDDDEMHDRADPPPSSVANDDFFAYPNNYMIIHECNFYADRLIFEF